MLQVALEENESSPFSHRPDAPHPSPKLTTTIEPRDSRTLSPQVMTADHSRDAPHQSTFDLDAEFYHTWFPDDSIFTCFSDEFNSQEPKTRDSRNGLALSLMERHGLFENWWLPRDLNLQKPTTSDRQDAPSQTPLDLDAKTPWSRAGVVDPLDILLLSEDSNSQEPDPRCSHDEFIDCRSMISSSTYYTAPSVRDSVRRLGRPKVLE
jgi:hypothetical protein